LVEARVIEKEVQLRLQARRIRWEGAYVIQIGDQHIDLSEVLNQVGIGVGVRDAAGLSNGIGPSRSAARAFIQRMRSFVKEHRFGTVSRKDDEIAPRARRARRAIHSKRGPNIRSKTDWNLAKPVHNVVDVHIGVVASTEDPRSGAITVGHRTRLNSIDIASSRLACWTQREGAATHCQLLGGL